MDDIAAKLSELLSDPEGLEQMKSLANTFLNGSRDEHASEPAHKKEEAPFDMPDIDVGMLMKLAGMFKNSADDDRSRLLLSLKPHLSTERQERVDQAVKILKLIALWPVISESGILKGLF